MTDTKARRVWLHEPRPMPSSNTARRLPMMPEADVRKIKEQAR